MNTIRAFTIQPDDNHATDTQLPVHNQLEALQCIVGGWVEVVTSSDGTVTFWLDEEGKISDLPINSLATAFWWVVCPEMANHDTLRGPVVITGGFDNEGATLPVTENMAKMLVNIYLPEGEE